MNVDAFLAALRGDPRYRDQIVHVHEQPARSGCYAPLPKALSPAVRCMLSARAIDRLYSHQADAIERLRGGKDVIIATGTASGKSLCYTVPLIERLQTDPDYRALLLFPTKALCQDQFRNFHRNLEAAGLLTVSAGVLDGDTPPHVRRNLRDHGAVIFSNPDMIHAGLLAQHARWADFLSRLQLLVIDELHTCNGIFGSNMAHLLRRLFRICRHYGSCPQVVGCSATIANPAALAETLIGRPVELVSDDGSPRGRRVTVFWNPPRMRETTWHSRRSANVEAHELMARLVADGVPTITFSKARLTAEMIYRYVRERLQKTAPGKADKVTPYRGGYIPEERRKIEKQLFDGQLLGVSTTPALELGIDVGSLEACIVVGYPGTLASFVQQAGRAGRREADCLVFMIGLDTSVNQYVMSNPDYIFERCIEEAVIQPDNPFVMMGHMRCAAHEMPLSDAEVSGMGGRAEVVRDVLENNRKITRVDDLWYHAANEIPQHEVSLRNSSDANVILQDIDTGAVLGEVDRYDAPPLVHPHAVYLQKGETYIVQNLDLDRNLAFLKREDVDYYTQPFGGTDIHHIDNQLREKPFGSGRVFWGEVTAYSNTHAFKKIHFYSLDTISVHGLDLPTMSLDTMAFWIVPPEPLMQTVREAGLDAHSGLRGVGYATRMLLPLFMTCDTLDFSHTVGSVNSPWNAIFVYERFPLGLGFTEKAFENMHAILPAVLKQVRACPCEAGCPCCVGKPLRQFASWNVELHEASIPSKAAAVMILEGLLGDATALRQPEVDVLSDSDEGGRYRLEQALRRRIERMREPRVFHPIRPAPEVKTEYPEPEKVEDLATPDVSLRAERRRAHDRDMHRRIAEKITLAGLDPLARKPRRPKGMTRGDGDLRPTDFPGCPPPEPQPPVASPAPAPADLPGAAAPIRLGDSLAARARKRYKNRKQSEPPTDEGT